MVLAHPIWLFLLVFLPLPWLWLRRKGYLGFSDLRLFKLLAGNSFLYKLPLLLITLSFVPLVIALARPQLVRTDTTKTIKARDIVIAVDISGSMKTRFEGEIPKRDGVAGELDKEVPQPQAPAAGPGQQPDPDFGHRRIDAAQGAVLRFVVDRYIANAGDRIGIVLFDTQQYWAWPLTDDLKTIYRKGQFINQGAIDGGTNFGEWKPGPIDAAADHFDDMGKSATRVLIMITDGEDDLDEGAKQRLEKVIRSHNIHFNVIGVGPTLAKQDVDIIKLAQRVNGHVYRVENAEDLARCFDSINELEQTVVQVESNTHHQDIFYYFACAALGLFLLGVLAEALIVSQ